MDSIENRRKSKRLSEKWINSNETNKSIEMKTKTKCKPRVKCLKLKENETIVRKSSRCCPKRQNGIIDEVISEPKYGLRKLAPINWKERLDTRHVTNDYKSNDNKSIEKTKAKSSHKIDDKINSKQKKIKTNKVLVKMNGKIISKDNYKLDKHSVEVINNKRKRRKTNKTNGNICGQLIDKTNQNKCIEKIDVQVIDSSENSSDLCLTNSVIEQQIPESEEHEEVEALTDNISYIQYLELCSESQPKGASLSLNIIINLLKQKLKYKKRNTKKSNSVDNKKTLYSCGSDFCDSKKCQNH